MRALAWMFGVAAAIAAMFLTLFGVRGAFGIPMPVVLLAGVGGVLLFRGRTVRTLEVGWSGGAAVATPVREIALAPAGLPRTGAGSVARSLARVESRELFASPWFAAGIGLWIVVFVAMGVVWAEDVERSWWEFFGLATMLCHPFAGLAIVAAHRNRTRAARDGCAEVFDACPADGDARTLGHLLTAWLGAAVCAALLLLFALAISVRNPRIYGPIDGEALAALLACAAIGAGAVVLGVTLGRWLRWAVVPFAVLPAIALASGQINKIGAPGWSPARLLATFVASPGTDTILTTRPVWARLGWLVALVVLVAALGLVAARSTRLPRIVAGSAAIAAVVTALLVARPISHASAVELADRIVNPMAHQTCRSPVAQLRVCAYADYAELATRTAAAVGPVGAAVPDGVLDDVVFLTYMADGFEHLQSEVRAAIGERRTSLPEHPMRLRFNSHPDNFDAARLRLAAHAVGLPTEATRIGTVVAGQARGVVALWLATRGLDARAAGRFVRDGSVDHPDVPDATDRGAIWPGLCHDEVGVLQWAPKDLVAVRALMARPSADVARLLHDGWSRFTAPTTTTDELLVAAGLAPLGPPERVEARDYRC